MARSILDSCGDCALKKCAECGKDLHSPDWEYCISCQATMSAVEKPQELQDLEAIWAGQEPRGDGQTVLRNLLRTRPGEFVRLMKDARREHIDKIARLERKPQQSEVESSPDEGTARVQDMIGRLLNECKE